MIEFREGNYYYYYQTSLHSAKYGSALLAAEKLKERKKQKKLRFLFTSAITQKKALFTSLENGHNLQEKKQKLVNKEVTNNYKNGHKLVQK